MAFKGFKRSNMGSAVLVVGRFVDIENFPFQSAKRSDRECVELQGRLFADWQVRHIQAAKR